MSLQGEAMLVESWWTKAPFRGAFWCSLLSGRSPGEGNGNLLQYSYPGIPWTEPGRVQSMGSQRVGHDWVTYHFCELLCLQNRWRDHSCVPRLCGPHPTLGMRWIALMTGSFEWQWENNNISPHIFITPCLHSIFIYIILFGCHRLVK